MTQQRITKITAHRGYRKGCKENTLAAFEHAIQRGADRIEMDLHFTKDRDLVVHHDYYATTIDGKSELILNATRSQLVNEVSSLWEVLEFVGQSVELEFELKGATSEFVDMVLETARRFNILSRVEFTSPHPFVLSYLRRISSEANLGMFAPRFPDWMKPELGHQLISDTLDIGRIDVAHCPFSILSADLVEKLHRSHKRVHAADCNTQIELRSAFELAVDQLSTDELDLAKKVREEIQGN